MRDLGCSDQIYIKGIGISDATNIVIPRNILMYFLETFSEQQKDNQRHWNILMKGSCALLLQLIH